MSRAPAPNELTAPEREHDSKYLSDHAPPRGAPARDRRALACDRRNRGRDRECHRDMRPIHKGIKLEDVVEGVAD